MVFYTCVSSYYKDLIPLYNLCVKRVYPDADVIIDKEPQHPACKRFLKEVKGDYIHVTDADILILPHEKTHQEYYSQFEVHGACYLRGATEGHGKKWIGDKARIAGGHVGFTPEYYWRTRSIRSEYLLAGIENYPQFDEVMLAKILQESDYPIPAEPYTFYNGTKWDPEYRDLHLNDFASMKYLKWLPDREKIKELFKDPDFWPIVEGIDSVWRNLIHKIKEYAFSK